MKRLVSLLLVLALCWGAACLAAADATPEYRTWLQSDSRWGSIPFGNAGDTMAKSGCAITSVAKLMVHSGAVSTDPTVFNPGILCNFLKNNGGITTQGWLLWAAVDKYTKSFRYAGEAELTGTPAQKTAVIQAYINDGCVVVAMVKNGGHYVAVDKVENDTVYIMDPARTGYTRLFEYPADGVAKVRLYRGPTNGTAAAQVDYTVDPLGAVTYTITSDDGVNLRSGPATSYDKLTVLPYGAKVKVTKTQNGWGYTTYNKVSGWFTLQYAKAAAATLRGLELKGPAKTAYTVGEAMDLTGLTVTALYSDGTSRTVTDYTVSGFSSAKAGSVQVSVIYQGKGARFTVTVAAKTYKPGDYVIRSSNGVNLRKSPTDGAVITVLPDGARLTVTKVQENWGQAVYNGQTGWFCLDYAQATTAAQTGITAKPLAPCLLSGASVTEADVSVQRVYADGSQSPLTEFKLTLTGMRDGVLTATVSDGDFSATVNWHVFESVPMGDCNFDGRVDAADALAALCHAVDKPAGRFYVEAADVDANQTVNASDALQILRYAVRKIESFNE